MKVKPDWPADLPTKISFVAEAPGADEVRKGRVLVGPSGRVFNQLMRTAGLDRSRYHLTNVFDEQLPPWQGQSNSIIPWCGKTAEAKKWREDGYSLPPVMRGKFLKPEHAYHLERLAAELERAKPTLIVPMGGLALWALTGYSNILARRGAVDISTMTYPGVKIVPTVHPAYLFHSWKMFPIIAADFERALAQSEFPEVRHTERELWIEPTVEDIWRFKREHLDGAPYISFDIETIPSYRALTMISFAPGPHAALCVPFVDARQPDRSYWRTAEEEVAALEAVRAILEGPEPKLAQNGSYDVQWVWETWGIAPLNYVHDTRLLHFALYPEFRKDLGLLGSLYEHQGPWKLMRSKKTEKRDE